jgi:hypothetical protein
MAASLAHNRNVGDLACSKRACNTSPVPGSSCATYRALGPNGATFSLRPVRVWVQGAAIFIKSIRCRARKTILSPALISPDTVHRLKATLSGSMRKVLQNVSSPN